MAQGDVLFQIGGISPLASSDLLQTHDERSGMPADEGQVGWIRDKFGGLRLFTFRKNINGSEIIRGELHSRKVVAVTGDGTHSTTVIADTAAFTADELVGSFVVVTDDAGGAGAAPEGEYTLVKSNTANALTLHSQLPLSVAFANSDTARVISPRFIDSADGDYNHIVGGIAMAAIPDDDWGWYQFQGLCPGALYTTAAVPEGEPVVADVAALADDATDKANLWVGYNVGAIAGDLASPFRGTALMSLLPVYW